MTRENLFTCTATLFIMAATVTAFSEQPVSGLPSAVAATEQRRAVQEMSNELIQIQRTYAVSTVDPAQRSAAYEAAISRALVVLSNARSEGEAVRGQVITMATAMRRWDLGVQIAQDGAAHAVSSESREDMLFMAASLRQSQLKARDAGVDALGVIAMFDVVIGSAVPEFGQIIATRNELRATNLIASLSAKAGLQRSQRRFDEEYATNIAAARLTTAVQAGGMKAATSGWLSEEWYQRAMVAALKGGWVAEADSAALELAALPDLDRPFGWHLTLVISRLLDAEDTSILAARTFAKNQLILYPNDPQRGSLLEAAESIEDRGFRDLSYTNFLKSEMETMLVNQPDRVAVEDAWKFGRSELAVGEDPQFRAAQVTYGLHASLVRLNDRLGLFNESERWSRSLLARIQAPFPGRDGYVGRVPELRAAQRNFRPVMPAPR